MRRKVTQGSLALLAAFALSGCSDDGDTIVASNTTLSPTNADAIASGMNESWVNAIGTAINEQGIDEQFSGARIFRARDGAGILAYVNGDGIFSNNGFASISMVYFSPSGAIASPPVELRGTMAPDSLRYNDLDTMVLLWTPNGDAVFAFIATEADDPSSTTDVESERVYYGSFVRNLANTEDGTDSRRYGFTQTVTTVDTNTDGTNDNDVDTLFAGTNLVDGFFRYNSNNSLEDRPSGSTGNLPNNEPYYLYLGWIHEDTNDDNRIEGAFVDLDDLTLGSTSALNLSPAPVAGEDVRPNVVASGRDLLFSFSDEVTAGVFQERSQLIRVNDTRDGFEAPIEITRGTLTAGMHNSEALALIGDGFRALNGQTSTWILYQDFGFVDATITNPDFDLVAAQIDDDGTVAVMEIDHEAPDSMTPNNVTILDAVVSRGATRVFGAYSQTAAVSTNNTVSAYGRFVRLDGTKTLAQNVSAEQRLNSRLNATDVTGDLDSNVTGFKIAQVDPFCGADCNNDAVAGVLRQGVDEDDDSVLLEYFLATITDFDADPIAFTVSQTTIVSDADEDYDDDFTSNFDRVSIVESNSPDGDAIVFYVANGNNIADSGAANSFDEERMFAFSPDIDGQNLAATQIGTPASLQSFPDWNLIDLDPDDIGDDGVGGIQDFAVVTPMTAADRDYTFDDDEACPDWAVVVIPEFLADDNGARADYYGRVIDLRASSTAGSAADRFLPPLTTKPALIGTGVNADGFTDDGENELNMAVSGNGVLFVFNSTNISDSSDIGDFYVNTWNAGVGFSNAARLSNSAAGPIADPEGAFNPDFDQWLLVPGVSAAGSCFQEAAGAWFFWLQEDAFDEEIDQLQGRRFRSTNLPR